MRDFKNIIYFFMACLTLAACKNDPEVTIRETGCDMIKLNQVGYFPDAPKKFVVGNFDADSFMVVSKSGEKVHEGKMVKTGIWDSSGETVIMGDFSKVTLPGEYRVMVKGLGTSWPFTIGAGIYNDVAKASMRSFYLQRMSMDLQVEFAGEYSRPSGHPDSICYYHPSTGHDSGFISSPGGWYDAGDYGKYIVNGAVSVGALLNLVEIKPGIFTDSTLNIPESGNGLSDYLDEIKYELDWMLTMQDKDGGIFHKITTKNFEAMVMPVEATNDRFVIGKSTAASLDFAAVMAMAGRIYRSYDLSFANGCRDAAIKAYQWAVVNPDAYYARNPEDVFTGAYNDVHLKEEKFWAASELFITTGEAEYYEEIKDAIGSVTFRISESWRNYVDNLGYYSLLASESYLTDDDKKQVLDGLVNLADSIGNVIENHPYRIPINEFQWGSNSDVLNLATILIVAYHYTNDQKYLNDALETLDYILGKNVVSFSFVTGFGGKSPMNIHHRPSEADGILNPVPGFVVGGPNDDRQDRFQLQNAGQHYAYHSPAGSYIDHMESYASNEICLNWNAPLTFVLGYLHD